LDFDSHAKILSIDYGYSDENAYIGSINFSVDSETENRELGQTTQNSTALQTIYNTFVSDYQGGTLWTKT
jgi:phosphatidylserine/phosphatidylglycerophosphate/cardiolipin synthase-like enzyme